ncbi:MAG TPA: redoxin domain-containing protein [Anaerolineales bacterium]
MQCRQHVGQLVQLYPQFRSAGAEVLVILGERLGRARRYAEILNTPFPVLADLEREVYAQFGLEKSFLVIQRTASVIVDRQGVIRYVKRATNPMTWLQDSSELVEIIKDLNKDDKIGSASDDE